MWKWASPQKIRPMDVNTRTINPSFRVAFKLMGQLRGWVSLLVISLKY